MILWIKCDTTHQSSKKRMKPSKPSHWFSQRYGGYGILSNGGSLNPRLRRCPSFSLPGAIARRSQSSKVPTVSKYRYETSCLTTLRTDVWEKYVCTGYRSAEWPTVLCFKWRHDQSIGQRVLIFNLKSFSFFKPLRTPGLPGLQWLIVLLDWCSLQ
jgi:hypothetical protein